MDSRHDIHNFEMETLMLALKPKSCKHAASSCRLESPLNHLIMNQGHRTMARSELRELSCYWKMAPSMRVSGTKRVRRMDVVFKFGLMVPFTKDIGKRIKPMEEVD